MPKSSKLGPTGVWEEVAVLGPYPHRRGIELLLLGYDGSDAAWALAVELAGAYLTAAGDRAGPDMGLIIIDGKSGGARGARAFRRKSR